MLLRARRKVARLLSRDFVSFGDVSLPPKHLRRCGVAFKADATYLHTSKEEALRLRRVFGVGRGSSVLEIGCGTGRLPIGLLAIGLEVARYDGVDIDRRAIDWCRRHLGPRTAAFRFHHVDVGHARYNPEAPPMDRSFRLPLPGAAYDLIYLHSVFSNVEPEVVAIYAGEFRRLLKPDGDVFLTAFVEENVPPATENPSDYHIACTGPLNVVRFEKGYFLQLLTSAGLAVVDFAHAADLDGQSAVHLRRA